MAMLVLLSRAMCCVESSSLDGGEPAGDHEGEQRTGRGHGKDCGEPGRGGTGRADQGAGEPGSYCDAGLVAQLHLGEGTSDAAGGGVEDGDRVGGEADPGAEPGEDPTAD